MLQEKCLTWAEAAGHTSFKASPGSIDCVLKDNKKVGVNLHGEGMDLSEEEVEKIMEPFRKEFHEELEKLGIQPPCVYNGVQTGLFYNKLPNQIYVKKK
jgi:hypothetical protein